VPDLLHEARHRAGHNPTSRREAGSRRQAKSKRGRVFAGLALPSAAAFALVFCAAGAAVATSAKAQTNVFLQSALVMTSRHTDAKGARLKNLEQSRAVASHLQTVEHNLAIVRAAAVARGVERKKLADVAKREALAHSWRLPVTNPVLTSGFGYRWGQLHAGEDFAVSVGTPLPSMSTGTVIFGGAESGFGNLVKIRYWDGTISYYGHMSVISVNVGESERPGQIVGQSGNTGHSTGPHLHLEIHPNGGQAVDPLPWLASHHIPA
jgi:murein DD-endopeptidase MepM/ murein hydrolase activator NlpD